jgi:hypothetical protein
MRPLGQLKRDYRVRRRRVSRGNPSSDARRERRKAWTRGEGADRIPDPSIHRGLDEPMA